ncbi:hypothetical protein QAD02_015920 [Eretmocerus hayati]|uniref:Uncharacterized protein n=1 Tax=Eretmocerus hayati TaxID=131215 RepID=A0ACC2PAM1_9HYME|nr:hypothetical protein QAD02_015920 [Eretmocerus hayati]
MTISDADKLKVNIASRRNSILDELDENQNELRILHCPKPSLDVSSPYKAPVGVNPFHVGTKKIRKFSTGGSKLVFIWPRRSSHQARMPSLLVPVFRLLLMGLVWLDTLHLWPGEFMPNQLPPTLPPPLPPVKCNVIEPRWSDNS